LSSVTKSPRLMAPKDAAIATSLSRTLLTLMAAEGQFPQPVQLGERRIAYVRSEVEDWIDARIAARRIVADNDNQRHGRAVA
jgi:prophage regulatory protein